MFYSSWWSYACLHKLVMNFPTCWHLWSCRCWGETFIAGCLLPWNPKIIIGICLKYTYLAWAHGQINLSAGQPSQQHLQSWWLSYFFVVLFKNILFVGWVGVIPNKAANAKVLPIIPEGLLSWSTLQWKSRPETHLCSPGFVPEIF